MLISVLAVSCTQNRTDGEENSTAGSAVVAVKVAPIIRGNVDLVVTGTGKTEALRTVKVFSPVGGSIVSMEVLEGMAVKGGEIVAVIRSKESQAAIAGSEALLRSARTPGEEEEARKALYLAQSTQSKVAVRAPFDGIVGTRSAAEGELITENTELFTLIDLSTIGFVADVPLRDFPLIRAGQHCSVRFPTLPGPSLPARVDAINPQTDTPSQTVKARLVFTDRGAGDLLRTGIIGIASIIVGTHLNALIAPKEALHRDDESGTFSLVTVTHDSLARVVSVRVGASTDSTVEVVSNSLQEGMNVIVEGQYALTDSTRVTVGQQRN